MGKKEKKGAKEYIRPNMISILQRRGMLDKAGYQTLSTVLGDSSVAASIDGTIISCFDRKFEDDRFLCFNGAGNDAYLYPQNCIGNRNAQGLLEILVKQGYDCNVLRVDDKIIAYAHAGEQIADIYMTDEYDAMAEEWIAAFTKKGYQINMWAGGEQPFLQIMPNETKAIVRQSHDNHYHAAESGVAIVKRMGYDVLQQ